MIAIISLLFVVFFSILITRIGAIALIHTGLNRESARFQARSAFSGAGFTTKESEMVVSHPVRRKIVMVLILIGNAGIVAAISSLILTFVRQGESASLTLKIVILVTGIILLWALANSQWVDRQLSTIVERLLKKYTRLNVKDYASLLHLTGDFRLVELRIRKTTGWTGKRYLNPGCGMKGSICWASVNRMDPTSVIPLRIHSLYTKIVWCFTAPSRR